MLKTGYNNILFQKTN